jgi:hypothetical protein
VRFVLAVVCLVLTSGACLAQSSDLASAAAAFDQSVAKAVHWNFVKAKRADIACHGRSDTILFGTTDKSVWVGVLPVGGKPQVLEFSSGGNSESGFGSPPKAISITAHDCDTGEGTLPGCRKVKGCKDFGVENDADTFWFYWDSERQRLAWWRR